MERLGGSVAWGQQEGIGARGSETLPERSEAAHGTNEGSEAGRTKGPGKPGDSAAELAHDARNLITALELYCCLLGERGVLSPGFGHFAGELMLVAEAGRRLVEKLSRYVPDAGGDMEPRQEAGGSHSSAGMGAGTGTGLGPRLKAGTGARHPNAGFEEPLPEPIASVAAELAAKRNLMMALAGPGIVVALDLNGGELAVGLTREDLTRILVNLVKNAVEALPDGGRIDLSLSEFHADGAPWLALRVDDTGPGIPESALESIFEAGYSTRARRGRDGSPPLRRGLGLSITRAIVEAAGGTISAANRPQGGARFEIELPARAA